MMIENQKIKSIYKSYGFEEKKSKEDGVLVFTIRSGHFHNADIVVIDKDANRESVFEQYKSAGYACTFRMYDSEKDASLSLFKGFFSVKSAQERHRKEYDDFTKSVVSKYSETAEYSYISVDYLINGREGKLNVIDEIFNNLSKNKPILFLIEAAAGFGKTCTSYELLKELISRDVDKIPLFSELSRNRQAKIFKYVLLDEIDRSFPQLNSSLVTSEIIKGNVPVILDGFDELLHRSSDNEGYNNAEPMMETIGELLNGKAKVVLTTRRTAIFDGDDFHEWMNAHEEDFDIVRIRLKEPSIENWLPKSRLDLLLDKRFPIEKISNPVLLSYLRCINDNEFNTALDDSDALVDTYFDSLLDRERKRQDLRMRPSEQYKVLKSIAEDMLEFNYTAETRDYMLICIVEKNGPLIEDAIKNYPRDEMPTIDELANKLASHALLDRTHESGQGIGFVNEFSLGNFCADCIIEDKSGEWSGDQRFIEPCVLSYTPRSVEKRNVLWNALMFRMEFEEPEKRITSSILLTDRLSIDLDGESVSEITIKNAVIGNGYEVKNTIFVNCLFVDVEMKADKISDVSFVNCSFYSCTVTDDGFCQSVYFLNCTSDNDFISSLNEDDVQSKEKEIDKDRECEIFVLEKFWPKGRESFVKHRPIGGLCTTNKHFKTADILAAITRLKARNILMVPDKVSFVEININEINSIKEILGR